MNPNIKIEAEKSRVSFPDVMLDGFRITRRKTDFAIGGKANFLEIMIYNLEYDYPLPLCSARLYIEDGIYYGVPAKKGEVEIRHEIFDTGDFRLFDTGDIKVSEAEYERNLKAGQLLLKLIAEAKTALEL